VDTEREVGWFASAILSPGFNHFDPIVDTERLMAEADEKIVLKFQSLRSDSGY